MKTHFIHINPMHLIVGAGAALGATAAGLSATMLPHASGHWIEPAAMLGLIGGVFGYMGFDLIARYRARLPGARKTLRILLLTLAVLPVAVWLIWNDAILAILGGLLASVIVYFLGRMDDNGIVVSGGGFSSESNAFDIFEDRFYNEDNDPSYLYCPSNLFYDED